MISCGFPRELADLEEIQAEGLDLREYAVQGRLIQEAGEHGLRAAPARCHRRERTQHRRTEVALDPDPVQGGCRVHAAMVEGREVTPHRSDQVSAWLPHQSGGQ